ncbi:MAG: AI-2E family transporter [Pseudomonadota bacterium]
MTVHWRDVLRWFLLILAPVILVLTGLLLLKQILLPFLVGMAAAYMLDPAADRLERLRFSRTTATAAITGSFFLLLTVMVLLILPELGRQAADLASKLPNYVDQLRDRLVPLVAGLIETVGGGADFSAEGLIRGQASQAINVVMRSVTSLLQSGVALLNLVALMFVTPIVTFYLLRDWDHMVAKIRSLVPPHQLATADRLGREIDEVLAGFLRGQGMVCSFLAVFYAIGLEAAKLDYGLIIGLLTGFFSFIPFIGMAIGMAVGLSVAAFQFQEISMLLVIAGIFGLGQFIEGNLISPRLVGSRIHLHPVWMIFSVLAGTTLFGFLGTLLAVPFAAVLGVLIRFGLERYQQSALFDTSEHAAVDDRHGEHDAETAEPPSDIAGVDADVVDEDRKKTGTLG